MNLQILGARCLVRSYALPEKIGSIIVPQKYQDGFDGKLWEVVQVGDGFKEALTCVGNIGPKLVVSKRERGDPPLEIEPDDLLQTRGFFRGVHAGPDVERHFGYPCWFIEASEKVTIAGVLREMPTVEWVWPCKAWRTAA